MIFFFNHNLFLNDLLSFPSLSVVHIIFGLIMAVLIISIISDWTTYLFYCYDIHHRGAVFLLISICMGIPVLIMSIILLYGVCVIVTVTVPAGVDLYEIFPFEYEVFEFEELDYFVLHDSLESGLSDSLFSSKDNSSPLVPSDPKTNLQYILDPHTVIDLNYRTTGNGDTMVFDQNQPNATRQTSLMAQCSWDPRSGGNYATDNGYFGKVYTGERSIGLTFKSSELDARGASVTVRGEAVQDLHGHTNLTRRYLVKSN